MSDGHGVERLVGRRFAARALAALGLAAGVTVALLVAWKASQVLLVLFLGVLFGIFLDAVAHLVARVVPAKPRSVLRVLLVLALTLSVAAGVWLGPELADLFVRFFRVLPRAVDSLRESLGRTPWARTFAEQLPDFGQIVAAADPTRIAGLFSSALGGLAGLFIVVFVGIYTALDPPRYAANALRALPEVHRERGGEVLAAVHRALQQWLLGRFVDMLVLATVIALGLWWIGVPFALPLGLLAGALEFVPYVGPMLSVVPAALVALQTDDPHAVLWVLGLYAVAQVAQSYVVTPLIEQRAVDVPPALGLATQAVLGLLAGGIGVVVATPLLVVIIVLVQSLWIEGGMHEQVRVIGERSDEDGA